MTTQKSDNECDKIGFQHAWEDTTPNFYYATYPPSYPDREETCGNCGLKRWHRLKKWIEYSDGREANSMRSEEVFQVADESMISPSNLTDGTNSLTNFNNPSK